METRNDAQSRRLSLIDVSSEDDSLIATVGNPLDSIHSVDPVQVESLTVMTGNELEKPTDNHEGRVTGYQPMQNVEVYGKNSKYNLRKSLAWDSAFFTSAGVLEPSELSNIMESADRSERQVVKLPRIQEDVNRSCDSLSTLSDSLESLEADLFEDIRASIQKSSNKSTVGNGSNKLVSSGSQFHTGTPSKTVDMESRNKMKLASSCRNPSTNMHTSKKTTKNPGCPQVIQNNVSRSEQLNFSKQSKVLHKSGPSSISSKKDMLDDLHAKTEKDSSKHRIAGSKVGSMSKTAAVSGSHATMPKRTLLTKPSSGSSVANKSRSSSSSSFAGNSSGNGIGTSLSNTVKKKVFTTSGILPSSGSTAKATSRFTLRNKMQPKITDLPPTLKSVSNLSSCTSPASSISEWSSESSPSTSSTVKQKSNSRTSLDSGSDLKAASDAHTPNFAESQNLENKQSLEGKRKQDTGYSSERVNNAPAAPLHSGPTKPSGLRLPSPKIGFFDRAKPSPSGGMQSHTLIPGGLPKEGGKIIPRGEQISGKFGKLQPVRSSRAIKTPSSDNQQTSVSVTPEPSIPLQITDAVVETCRGSENHESDETSMVVQNEVPFFTFTRPKDILGGGHNNDVLDPAQGSAEANEVLDNSLYQMKPDIVNSQLKDVIPPPPEGKCEDGVLSSACCVDSGDNRLNSVKFQNIETEAQSQVVSDLNMVPGQTLRAFLNKGSPEDNGMQSKDMEGISWGAECGPYVLNSTSNICKSESPSVDKGSMSAEPDLKHELCPLNVSDDEENLCENQVDSSTGQFELLLADSEIPNEESAGDSNKECHSDKTNSVSIICDSMVSPVVGKASAGNKTDGLHLSGPSGTDVQKIQSDIILIDSLTSKFEALEINKETEKEIESNSLSPSKLPLQNNSDVLDSSKKLLDCQINKESVIGSQENEISTGSETVVAPICSRPLVVKDSLGNGEGKCNMPAESMVTELKMNLPLPQNILREKNSGNIIEMK